MYRYIIFTLALWMNPVYAQESLLFKKEMITNTHWFSYVLALFVLFVSLLILAKFTKKGGIPNPQCKIVERINIHHKTKVYVLDYQGQRLLLADNQSALAIYPLQDSESHHEH